MNVTEIIAKKQSGKAHSVEEILDFIHGYARGNVPDSAMAAWLMAVYFQGMTDEEIIAVVESMITSGEKMDFTHLSNFVADKHSTGGVGDKVSLILGPLMAAAGLAIPMITGRSLGHTGGTLDKLESIPGYRTDLSLSEFRTIVETVGVSIIGQTDDMCPADKKIYALRDATSTVESIPLICGSIMSKKIAEGIQGLVLDIKVGNGAFMKTLDKARELAGKLMMVGNHFGISTEAVFSNMDQPLGDEAGLWNEVEESIRALQGDGPDDLMEVTYELGASLLLQSQVVKTKEEARKIQKRLISNGTAFQKFIEMIEAHGGDSSIAENPEKYTKKNFSIDVKASQSGYISSIDTTQVGFTVNDLTINQSKGKRLKDNTAGIRFHKKVGDWVQVGDIVYTCFGNRQAMVQKAANQLTATFTVDPNPVQPRQLLYK